MDAEKKSWPLATIVLLCLCSVVGAQDKSAQDGNIWDSSQKSNLASVVSEIPRVQLPNQTIAASWKTEIPAAVSLVFSCTGRNGTVIKDNPGITFMINKSFGLMLSYQELQHRKYVVDIYRDEGIELRSTVAPRYRAPTFLLGKIGNIPTSCESDQDTAIVAIRPSEPSQLSAWVMPLADTCQQVGSSWIRNIRVTTRLTSAEDPVWRSEFQWDQREIGAASIPQYYVNENQCRTAPVAVCFLDQRNACH